MYQDQIRHIIESRTHKDGLFETGVTGVSLFRATQSMPCVPAVYEPCIIAIASGAKEVVLDGNRFVYDNQRYLCCPMSMPVKAGTPTASVHDPLFGVLIALDQRVMSEVSIEMENAGGAIPAAKPDVMPHAIRLALWDDAFSEALLRLLQLGNHDVDTAVLGSARLRELFYAVLKGEAGIFARQSFGAGNAIARSIAHVSSNISAPISIDDMATRAGLSRAVFHRRFKQATAMSPIQFVKSMRLNSAAMKIASGMTVSEAAMDAGYTSPSQFSREFKHRYGQSPRHWGDSQKYAPGAS